MSGIITLSLCLSDIPKDKIKKADNGKSYANIVVSTRRESDRFGNTHTVYMSQSKQERESQTAKVFIGSGKEYIFNSSVNTQSAPVSSPEPCPAAADHDDNFDDLPF